MVRNRRGVGRLGCLVWLLILAAVAYLGTHFGEPWFRYQQYKDEMKTTASFGEILADSAIRVRMRLRADSLNLPVAARTVVITRTQNRITISAAYEEIVHLMWYGPVTLKFTPKVEGPL